MRNRTIRELRYEKFWTNFHQHLRQKDSSVSPKNTKLTRYDGHFHLGVKCNLSATIVPRRRNIGVEVFIPNCTQLFNELFEEKPAIENEFGDKLDWRSPEEYKLTKARIALEKNDINPFEEQALAFDWMQHHLEKLYHSFRPRVAAIMGPYSII